MVLFQMEWYLYIFISVSCNSAVSDGQHNYNVQVDEQITKLEKLMTIHINQAFIIKIDEIAWIVVYHLNPMYMEGIF